MKTAPLLAGFAHFGILIASALVPFALEWKKSLRGLPTLLRQLFWVYGAFIVMMILAFGGLTLVNLEELAAGETRLARTFCGLIAIFWFVRLLVQFLVFDATPHLTNLVYRVGYHALTLVFLFLVGVYGYASLR